MIGHTVVLIVRYSDIISLLTITVRGVSNKHCLLPFFICVGPGRNPEDRFSHNKAQIASFCSCTAWFVSNLVGNTKKQFN